MDQGFIDLRQNRSEAGLDGSFWPSFTDIMTVVVMIFIIASTVLIVRNWQLVAELRASLAAERQAAAAADSAREASLGLEGRLADLQRTVTESRLRHLQLAEEMEGERARAAALQQQLLAAGDERDRLVGELAAARQQAALLGDRTTGMQEEMRKLQQQLELRDSRLEETLAALARLEARHRQTAGDLAAVSRERTAVQEKLHLLQSEFRILDQKYQALVRPARSADGKQVAEVRYRRSGEEPVIEMRRPGEEIFRVLPPLELHRQLSSLKERLGPALYVKIIIPPENRLSYSEAWEFTRDLLQKYDYYYQD